MAVNIIISAENHANETKNNFCRKIVVFMYACAQFLKMKLHIYIIVLLHE